MKENLVKGKSVTNELEIQMESGSIKLKILPAVRTAGADETETKPPAANVWVAISQSRAQCDAECVPDDKLDGMGIHASNRRGRVKSVVNPMYCLIRRDSSVNGKFEAGEIYANLIQRRPVQKSVR